MGRKLWRLHGLVPFKKSSCTLGKPLLNFLVSLFSLRLGLKDLKIQCKSVRLWAGHTRQLLEAQTAGVVQYKELVAYRQTDQ